MAEDEADTSASGATTERLSCMTCRQRKVRCDRVHPCSNCVKAGFECTFPAGRRRPREGRYQLALRLQKLESHLQDLASSFNPQNALSTDAGPATPLKGEPSPDDGQDSPIVLSEDIGKLDISADHSRYSNNALWSTLSQEIAEMQNLLQTEEVVEVYDKDLSTSPSDPSSQDRTPETANWLFAGQELVSPADSLDKSILWVAYVENVAPLIRIFHLPTTKMIWQEASSGTRTLTMVEEVAFHSMYFAAAVSLQDSDCTQLFNMTKGQVIQIQRQSLEKCFQDVGLLTTGSVMVLQAYVMYLIVLRRLDDTRMVLSMFGIAARLALTVGLQRDSSNFKINMFDAEMRRRSWWQLSLLDFELSNDHGVEPLLQHGGSDTALPSNINDEDLRPGMMQAPAAASSFTKMTPSLVRFEISATSRKLLYTSASRPRLTLQQQRSAIEDLQERLRDQYLRYCSDENALQWSTTLVARAKVTMLWVSMYHQLQQGSAAPSQELNDKMMRAVIETVDNVRELESNAKTANWAWYFHNDVQWPATVYLLNEIIRRPPDALSDRAWDVLKRARDQWYANAGSKMRLQGMLFKPMRALTNRAFWVKEGKQPPSRMPIPKHIDFPELSLPEDLELDFMQYSEAPEAFAIPSLDDMGNAQDQLHLRGFESAFASAPEQMEDFMLPFWNQDWQFLAQNAPPP